MIDDEIDQIPGDKKKLDPTPRRDRRRWWPALRTVSILLTSAALTSSLSRLAYAPSALDLRDMEAGRAVPNFNVQVEEALGQDDGQMVLIIDVSNLGPVDHPVFAAIQPLQDWVSFGARTSARVDPPLPFDARIGANHATVRLRDPLKAGTHAKITLSGIDLGKRPSYGHTVQAISLNVYAGASDQRIRPHRELPYRKAATTPKPKIR